MLKFILVAFLFMGLAVNGQAQTDEQNVMTFHEASEQSQDEKAVNAKESEEEESSEENEAREVENFVSEDHSEEFDQNDDVGSKAMLEENNEAEQDDSSAWCRLPKCKSFQKMKYQFMKFRAYCFRCLRRKACRRVCGKFFYYRKKGFKVCMARLKVINKYFNRKLLANYKKIVKVVKKMRSYYASARLWNRRCSYKSRSWIQAKINKYKSDKAKAARKWRYANRYRVYWLRIRNSWWAKWRRNRRSRYYYNKTVWAHRKYKYFYNMQANAYKTWKAAKANLEKYQKWMTYKNKFFANMKAFRIQRSKRSYLIKVRKSLWSRKKVALQRQRRRCIKYWYYLRMKCATCHGRCGRVCWTMHVYYAHMVKQAHTCMVEKWYCGKKGRYKRYWYAYAKQCNWCLKKFKKKRNVKLLLCASRCGAARKFRGLFKYYSTKCGSGSSGGPR